MDDASAQGNDLSSVSSSNNYEEYSIWFRHIHSIRLVRKINNIKETSTDLNSMPTLFFLTVQTLSLEGAEKQLPRTITFPM